MPTTELARRVSTIRGKSVAPSFLIRIMHGKAFASESLAEAISKATQGAIGKRATMNPEGAQKRRARKNRKSNKLRGRNRARKGEYRKLINLYLTAR